jgi:acetoin utilization protein AcuB
MHEIMSSPVETIAPGTRVAEAKAQMKREGIHHLVVGDRNQILGVVSARDMTRAPAGTEVAELMATRVVTASPRDTVRDAANRLRGRGVGCLPIVEQGRAVGISSAAASPSTFPVSTTATEGTTT